MLNSPCHSSREKPTDASWVLQRRARQTLNAFGSKTNTVRECRNHECEQSSSLCDNGSSFRIIPEFGMKKCGADEPTKSLLVLMESAYGACLDPLPCVPNGQCVGNNAYD